MNDDLTTAVSDFLDHKTALGRKYVTEEATLRLLLDFADQHRVRSLTGLTPAMLNEYRLPAQDTRPQLQPPRWRDRLLPGLVRRPTATAGFGAAPDPTTGNR